MEFVSAPGRGTTFVVRLPIAEGYHTVLTTDHTDGTDMRVPEGAVTAGKQTM